MEGVSQVQALVDQEPWRLGIGQPRNALQLDWQPQMQFCDGQIEWEGTSRYWWCRKCGYVGWSSYTQHYPIVHPVDFLTHSIAFYLQRRQSLPQPAEYGTLLNQMIFAAGCVIRGAAERPPQQLTEFLRGLSAT